MDDNTLRNTLIGIIATTVIAFFAAWVQLNSRISVLEVQVKDDHALFTSNQTEMNELMDKVNDIQNKVTKLSYTKVDRPNTAKDEEDIN